MVKTLRPASNHFDRLSFSPPGIGRWMRSTEYSDGDEPSDETAARGIIVLRSQFRRAGRQFEVLRRRRFPGTKEKGGGAFIVSFAASGSEFMVR
ncbi:hypothetical protein SUGI_1008680 [Cryptomeria japonica]|nr:hypothetical protein SUGI_1008680 [Cryptomeria japonica]